VALAIALGCLPSLGAGVEPDLLFIALDAVPFSTVEEVRHPPPGVEPLFETLAGPARLVSSFPSTTSVAFGAILDHLDLEESPGYEARFFDWDEGRKAGGGPISYFRIRFAWRDFFDWNRKGVFRNALQSARPVRSSIHELDRALDEFATSHDPAYFVYVAATDTTAHLQGPAGLRPILVELDRLLAETRRRRAERPFITVLFSDHGIAGDGGPLVNVHEQAAEALRAAGLEPGDRLQGGRGAVLTPYGLVSSLEIYVGEGRERDAAVAVAAGDGVALCAWRSGDGWMVTAETGEATVERRGGGTTGGWRYLPSRGDPLGLVPVTERLADHDGWVSDAALFTVTVRGEYPDPLRRLAQAFALVENPASVVCSVAAGHMYGAKRTEMLARVAKGPLRWTHGALTSDASLGFLLSDAPGWSPPAAVRASDALVPFLRGGKVEQEPRVAAREP
jgi:hypothetical protein